MRRREKFIVLPASTEMVQRRWSEFKGCPEKTVTNPVVTVRSHPDEIKNRRKMI